ncbi:MAG: hypothetical protein IKO60_03635, partial [Bacteroidaceae bacterium]|nr:hypothetical protein [Bacteroidaceae bacterium]
NDNTNWVTIHEVTDADAAARNYVKNANYTTYEFTPTNTSDAFKYIKLTLNSMKGTGWTQLGEFHVVGANYGCAEHNWTSVGTVAATCTTPGGNESICTVCGAKKIENLTALASHSYVDGFCSVCGIIQSNYMSKNGDYYEASTPQHLKWLAARMDEKEDGNFKVKLTQDIDLNGSGFQGFSIGNSGIIFKGEFDGQGHWLKNFSISNLRIKQCALFGRTENASIHDFGMDKANVSLSAYYTQNTAIIVGNANKTTINRVAVTGGSKVSGFDHVGSIAGNTQGTTTISNCYSDAEVNSSYYQAGGFVGTSSGLTLEKSIFLGSVKAASDAGDVGGFISRIEADNSTTVRNNIMAATSITTGKATITPLCPDRTGTTWSNNRVAATTTFKSTNNDASAELKAGTTMEFDDLDGYQGKTTPDADMQCKSFYTTTMGWDMTNDWKVIKVGAYPVLVWMEDTTPTQSVTVSDAGYTTIAAAADLTIPDNVEVFAVQVRGDIAHLEPIETSFPQGEAVVVKAAAGSYEFPYAIDYAAEIANNDLKASDGSVKGNGSTIFALSNQGNGVGFYLVGDNVTVPEGKGYLVISAGVKAFYGFEEDDATGINEELRVNNEESTSIFNVAGQRRIKIHEGINIVNGKKILK